MKSIGKRRGYLFCFLILALDLLACQWMGAVLAAVAAACAFGFGEYAAGRAGGGVPCRVREGACYGKEQKLSACYQRVREKALRNGDSIPRTRLLLLPGEEINAYCFGARTIGVTDGALHLDAKTVEALLAHELGHMLSGDACLNMVLTVNCLGLLAVVLYYQLVLAAVVWILLLLGCLIGFFRFSFLSCFITGKLTGWIGKMMNGLKQLLLQGCRLLICSLGRQAELLADAYAARLGYGVYLRHFLERFAPDGGPARSFFEAVYDTHPSTLVRIRALECLEEEQRRADTAARRIAAEGREEA